MDLHTPRLVLREFRPEDAPSLFAYQTHPAYLAHNGRCAPTFEQVVAFVDTMRQWGEEVPRARYQLIITQAGSVIGTVGLRKASPDATTAEYGCELAPAAWGQGYAREASRALLAFGIRELGLERVLAQTQPDNQAALHLARSLGFRCATDGSCELAIDGAQAPHPSGLTP
jgi:RimJ/RimL family protein N-acetyltransferase